MPQVQITEEAAALNNAFTPEEAQELAVSLMVNLRVEGEAMASSNDTLLQFASSGARLDELSSAIADAEASGVTTITTYDFDALSLGVDYPFGAQGGPSPAIEASGYMTAVEVAKDGTEIGRRRTPCDILFSMVPDANGGWLTYQASELEGSAA